MLSPSPPSLADYVELGACAHTASPKSAASNASHLAQPTHSQSLFPILDLLIKILPTYYTKGRKRCLNIVMIAISMAFILSLPIYQLYQSIVISQHTPQLCVFAMHLFILCSSLARLYFFAKHFDFHLISLWHFNRQNVSCLFQQSSYFKKRMRDQLTSGAILITILYSIYTACGIWDEIITNSITKLTPYAFMQIAWYFAHFLFSLLPDMLMLCVVRIYFTECYLQIVQFTESMNIVISFSSQTQTSASLLLEDMLSFKHHDKYLKIHDMTTSYCRQLNCFVACWIITISIIYWFVITICFFTDWTVLHYSFSWTNDDDASALLIPLCSQFIVLCIQAAVSVLFMLWPAFKMTDSFRDLKEKISQQIQVLLKNRTYLHDDKLLDAIVYNHAFKKMNIADLNQKLTVYSKQKACLEILSQLELTMNEKPCSYQLFGISLNRYSIRDFVFGILIAKAVFFLWNGIE